MTTLPAQRGSMKGRFVPIPLDNFGTAWWRAVQGTPLEGTRIHDLRHTALTRITRHGGIDKAQKAAGHQKITTTQRYAHATAEDVREAMNKAAPVVAEVKKEKKA